jgi:Uma2 family endonuclease
MSTITSIPPKSAAPPPSHAPILIPPGDQRIAIRGLSWEMYDALSDAVGERQRVYLAYDGKDLEIMVKGRAHEHYQDLFGQLVHPIADDLHIPRRGAGETTWKRQSVTRGIEADQCYFFQADKLAKDSDALKRRSREIDDYPNPDLAIEIDLSDAQIDRAAIYGALKVPELWRFDGESVVIEQLGPEGIYKRAEASQFLPIRAEEVQRWVVEENTDDLSAWRERLRAWIISELAPRMQP